MSDLFKSISNIMAFLFRYRDEAWRER